MTLGVVSFIGEKGKERTEVTEKTVKVEVRGGDKDNKIVREHF